MRNQVVSYEGWLKARLERLAAEKEFTRQRDTLTRRRMVMPWERVEKSYRFEGPNGARSLADLFDESKGKAYYNYEVRPNTLSDDVGIRVFHKNERSEMFHTYFCYSRGVDMLNGAYHYLDLAPKGRDEAGLNFPIEWVRRHDQGEGTRRESQRLRLGRWCRLSHVLVPPAWPRGVQCHLSAPGPVVATKTNYRTPRLGSIARPARRRCSTTAVDPPR